MKKLISIIIGALFALPALAIDFTYTHEGQTLKYTTKSDSEVSVVGPLPWVKCV